MNKEDLNISFGIDLGITSVGWSVVDLNDDKILDKGVYLFTEADKAEDRRNKRSLRRRKKRKLHRIERIYKILESKNIYLKNTVESNLLEIRNKGIKEKIEMQDIVNIIFYFARHRGYIPFKDEEKETKSSEIVDNLRDKGYLACQIQHEIYEMDDRYRGIEYLIRHSDYIKELEVILNEQKKYYNKIDNEFIEEIKNIINSKRKFWEGPGGPRENQLNKFGRYKTKEDIDEYNKDNNYHKYLFEELIGNCSVYKNERKASMWNFYAECFNFYNDFVNLRIDGQDLDETNSKYFEPIAKNVYKLKSESINKIKDIVLRSKSVSYCKIFKETFNIDFSKIYGYKKDGKGNAEISKFEKIRYIKAKLENELIVEELLNNMEAYNKAIELIQVSPNEETRYEILKDNLLKFYSIELIEKLSKINLESKYSRLSEKALKVYLDLMVEHNENSSYIERNYKDEIGTDIEEEILNNYANENIKEGELKYINPKFIDEIVASPATKKSLRKAIKILNAMFLKFGYPKYICIENTRELLSKDKQKEYESKTLENQQKRNSAKKKLQQQGFDDNSDNIDKYLILEQSEFKCAYCNKDITIANCEIDHILPISITANDTFLNKIGACSQCNNLKSNRTPYEFLTTIGTYEEFKERITKSEKITNEKKNNLLFELNINKYEKNFKNRNLNDTAYATNELANQLKLFKKAYIRNNFGEYLDLNILKVPGQFTGIIRKRSQIEKDRNLKYHHAVDATIVALIPKLKIGKLINIIQNEPDKYWKINNLDEYRDKIYSELYITNNIKEELIKADFSNTRALQETQIKTSGQLFDANVSKVIEKNGEFYKIEQIDNIYNIMPSDFEKIFNKNKYFLCRDNNPELYERLFEIVKMYEGKKVNPFVEYCKENNLKENEKFNYRKHGIHQSNNPKSSIVVKLRYMTKTNNPYILDNKKLVKSKKQNKKEIMLMYDNTKSYCTRIYRNKVNSELYFMPIYKIFIDNKTKKIKTNTKYFKKIYDEYVGASLDNIEPYIELYNNEYVRFYDKNDNCYEGLISGFDKSNRKIAVKNCSKNITKSTKKIEKIKSNVLGLYNLNI